MLLLFGNDIEDDVDITKSLKNKNKSHRLYLTSPYGMKQYNNGINKLSKV